MEARFGRNIYCQECGKDDKIGLVWENKSTYHYRCKRCNVKVKELNYTDKKCPDCGFPLLKRVNSMVDGVTGYVYPCLNCAEKKSKKEVEDE